MKSRFFCFCFFLAQILNKAILGTECILPKVITPNPQGVRKWHLWGIIRFRWSPMMWSSWWKWCPYKRRPESSHSLSLFLPLSPVWGHNKEQLSLSQEEDRHQNLTHAGTLTSDLPASGTVRNKYLLFIFNSCPRWPDTTDQEQNFITVTYNRSLYGVHIVTPLQK